MNENKSNRLANSNSPYLLQHANNPVDWYPWGEEAFNKAKNEDKPIFLSIGYAACHWCHVMAYESFEDEAIATIMNEHFVNIKVDREERPDIDEIYMQAVVALTGSGGWPMSVFLTPDGKPFFGGTYFPPNRMRGLPSFRDVLLSVARAWKEDRERIVETGEHFSKWLHQYYLLERTSIPLDDKFIHQALLTLTQSYDWDYGGWGRAPKFPQPMAIEFLLRRAAKGDKLALEISNHALHAMAQGGMYDVIGGGFSRYSTDNEWLIPHFEKMLYDNAQLATAYLHAYAISRDEFLRQICVETLEFLLREMSNPLGGFYSSIDADSEGEEGKFYLWSEEEIRDVLKGDPGIEIFMAAHNVSERENFINGKLVLQRTLNDSTLAEKFGISIPDIRAYLTQSKKRLYDYRLTRQKPFIDDKLNLSWNSLAIMAFIEAYKYLKTNDYKKVAIRNMSFLVEIINLYGMFHSWRNHSVSSPALLEDYASFILALIFLYQIDPNQLWFKTAVALTEDMISNFYNYENGFFDTDIRHDHLIVRPSRMEDTPTPSGSALAVMALLTISEYIYRSDWQDISQHLLGSLQEQMVSHPQFYSYWLCALDRAISPSLQIAILTNPSDSHLQSFLQIIWESYRPNLTLAISNHPPPNDSPPLLQDRPLINNCTTAYICRDFVCLQPTNDPLELRAHLNPPP